MAIDDFSKEPYSLNIESSDNTFRPRVSYQTHTAISELSVEMGITISKTYDLIVQNSISDEDILDDIVESASNNTPSDYTDHHTDLISDLANKVLDLGRMPTRDEVNSDENLNGYYLYVLHFGSVENIKKSIHNYSSEASSVLTK